MSIDWGTALGAAAAMGTGLCFALSNVYIRHMQGARGGSPANAVFWGLAVNVVLYSLALLGLAGLGGAQAQLRSVDGVTAAFFAASGLVGIAGRSFKFGAVLRLGPTASASFRVASPMITVLIATLLLGERLTGASGLGVLLILAALSVIGFRSGRAAGAASTAATAGDEIAPLGSMADSEPGAGAASNESTRPGRLTERRSLPSLDAVGILMGLGSATAFAVGDLFRKMGIGRQPLPLLGALIGAAAALLAYGVYRAAVGQGRSLFDVEARAVKGFVGSGIFTGLAVLLFFVSLTRIPVSTAAPLSSIEPAANLALSRFVFRGSEPLGTWLAASVGVLLVGVTLVIRGAS